MLLSDETGKVDGRAEYATQSNMYYVTYKAADGRQVADWWGEENITAANEDTARENADTGVAVNDNGAANGTSEIAVPKVEYDFDAMVFELESAEQGDIGNAFLWSSTPQGHYFWLDFAMGSMMPEGQVVLDDMIAQYKAKQPAGDESKEFKLEEGKYYESRDGDVFGTMEDDGTGIYPFSCDDSWETWMPHGRNLESIEHEDDLIKEVPAPQATAS